MRRCQAVPLRSVENPNSDPRGPGRQADAYCVAYPATESASIGTSPRRVAPRVASGADLSRRDSGVLLAGAVVTAAALTTPARDLQRDPRHSRPASAAAQRGCRPGRGQLLPLLDRARGAGPARVSDRLLDAVPDAGSTVEQRSDLRRVTSPSDRVSSTTGQLLIRGEAGEKRCNRMPSLPF